jgi:Rrf2 family transcriptional regulator, iron-sulfur cluster assembly transcription factor
LIYSQSSKYAIRAFVNLASLPEGQFAMVKNIAEEEQIPSHFLAKILQQIARKGLLRSSKGPTGGFCLNVPAKKLKLIDIIDAVDGMHHFTACAGGLPECNTAKACSLCDRWKPVQTRIMGFLGRTTIADLVRDSKKKAVKPVTRKILRRA